LPFSLFYFRKEGDSVDFLSFLVLFRVLIGPDFELYFPCNKDIGLKKVVLLKKE